MPAEIKNLKTGEQNCIVMESKDVRFLQTSLGNNTSAVNWTHPITLIASDKTTPDSVGYQITNLAKLSQIQVSIRTLNLNSSSRSS